MSTEVKNLKEISEDLKDIRDRYNFQDKEDPCAAPEIPNTQQAIERAILPRSETYQTSPGREILGHALAWAQWGWELFWGKLCSLSSLIFSGLVSAVCKKAATCMAKIMELAGLLLLLGALAFGISVIVYIRSLPVVQSQLGWGSTLHTSPRNHNEQARGIFPRGAQSASEIGARFARFQEEQQIRPIHQLCYAVSAGVDQFYRSPAELIWDVRRHVPRPYTPDAFNHGQLDENLQHITSALQSQGTATFSLSARISLVLSQVGGVVSYMDSRLAELDGLDVKPLPLQLEYRKLLNKTLQEVDELVDGFSKLEGGQTLQNLTSVALGLMKDAELFASRGWETERERKREEYERKWIRNPFASPGLEKPPHPELLILLQTTRDTMIKQQQREGVRRADFFSSIAKLALDFRKLQSLLKEVGSIHEAGFGGIRRHLEYLQQWHQGVINDALTMVRNMGSAA